MLVHLDYQSIKSNSQYVKEIIDLKMNTKSVHASIINRIFIEQEFDFKTVLTDRLNGYYYI